MGYEKFLDAYLSLSQKLLAASQQIWDWSMFLWSGMSTAIALFIIKVKKNMYVLKHVIRNGTVWELWLILEMDVFW